MQNRTFGQREILRQNKQRARRGELPPPIPDYWRPKTRADCKDGPRPCPYVGCQHSLFLDVTPRGGLRIPYGEDPEGLLQMTDTCALDIADRGPVTLESIAQVQVITRERVRQIELTAMARMQESLAMILADDDEFGAAASRAMRQATPPKVPVSLGDFQKGHRKPKPSVVDWLSEVGSPPID